MITPLILGILALVALYKYIIYPIFFSPLLKIPAIRSEPWRKNPQDMTGELINILKEFPNIARFRILNRQMLILNNPSLVQHVLVNAYDYPKPSRLGGLALLLGKQSLLFTEGDEHKRQRKLMNPAFSHGHIKELVEIMWDKSLELARLFADSPERAEKGVDVSLHIRRATLDIIGLAGFGMDFASLRNEENALAQAFHETANLTNANRSFYRRILFIVSQIFQSDTLTKLARPEKITKATAVIQSESDALIAKKIEQERSGANKKDLLAIIVSGAVNEKQSDEETLNAIEMRDQVCTFLAAGHATSSVAAQWGLYHLSKRPDIQEKCRKELRSLDIFDEKTGAIIRSPTFEQFEGLKYFGNVCKEILRIIPPVPITPRVAAKDDYIGGYFIPKGTWLFIPIAALNVSPHVWGVDAEEFNPDRWDTLPDGWNNWSFLTFLHGPRNCIGRKFAEVELKCLMANLLLRFEVDEQTKGLIKQKISAVTTRPKDGMTVLLKDAPRV